MTVRRALRIVARTAGACGDNGTGIGLTLATFAPACFWTAIRYSNTPDFSPVQVVVGLELTQELVAGLVGG